MFVDNLIDIIKKMNNPTVLGLDPKIEYVPTYICDEKFSKYGANFKGVSQAILEFNKKIIDATCDVIGVAKPQAAYYEMYGIDGVWAFHETIKYAKERGMLVIADGKRNDIGSTAQCYSKAFLGRTEVTPGVDAPVFDADALTVNPYLGYDGIEPFIEDCDKYGKGIFVLVKTSNKSSGDFQDLITEGGTRLYETVASYVNDWGKAVVGKYGYSSVGAVVGATYPEQARVLRKIMKNSYILVPGYGAQGGTAKDAANSFNEDGLGAIVNASRSIMCAYKSDLYKEVYGADRFFEASRAEAIRMREDLNNAIRTVV